MRVAALLLVASVAACSRPAPPAGPVAVQPQPQPEPAPSLAAEDSNALDLHVVVQLDARRWVVADFGGCTRPATLSGCVTASDTAGCNGADTRIALSEAETAHLGAEAATLRRTPETCDAPPRGDRAYRVEGHPGGASGHLPASPAPWREGTGECGVPWSVSTALVYFGG